MSSEWEVSELEKEAINASRAFSFKDYPHVVFVNTGDVLSGKFLHANISESKGLPGQAKKALMQGDILLTEIRPGNGRYAYVNFDVSNYVVSTKFMVIESLGRIASRFLYHVLTNQAALDEFQRIAESRSGTFPQITFDSISHFPVPIPPKIEQEKLVKFFDALDRRITLLRETNTTLEAIAQTLFKSWFVDFDPVRAKMEGRTPEGMDEATAALFPGSFEPSELGEIPSGWVVGTVSEVLRLHKGSVNPSRMQETLFQHFSLPSFDAGQLPVLELGASIKSNKTTVPQDAVLLSKLNPHIPRVWLPSFVDENAVCSTEFLPLVPLENSSTNYIYALLSAPSFCAALTQLVTGTSNSHQRIKPDNLLSLSSVIAPDAVLSAFDQAIAPLMTQLKLAREAARTLAELRDALLPRLISGQLRLPEVEKQAAEALA